MGNRLTQAELTQRYRDLHNGGRYLFDGVETDVVPAEMWDGNCFARKLMGRVLRAYHANPGRVLDFGCGKANYAPRLWAANVNRRDWSFYDPGYEVHSHPPTGRFDYIVCADVMEHIIDYEEALDFMVRRATANASVFFAISANPDRRAFLDGVNFHVTLKSGAEWRRLLRKYFRGRYIYVDVSGEKMEVSGAVL